MALLKLLKNQEIDQKVVISFRLKCFILILLFITVKIIVYLLINNGTETLYVSHYEQAAINVISGNGLSVIYEDKIVPMTLYPPGFSIMIGLIYYLLGINKEYVIFFQIILSTVTFAGLFYILKYFFNENNTVIICLIYIFNPLFWSNDIILNTATSPAITFLLISLIFYTSFLKKRKIYLLILSGLSLGIASSIRSEYSLFYIVFFFIILIRFKVEVLYFIIGVITVIIPMTIRNYINFNNLNPYPPGQGLALVYVIGKFYPSPKDGIVFGDNEILNAEHLGYTTLTYPFPYKRDRDRLLRALKFIKDNKIKYLNVLIKNLPRAWFGNRLNLFHYSGDSGIQRSLYQNKSIFNLLKSSPFIILDALIAALICILMLITSVIYLIKLRREELIKLILFWLPSLVMLLVLLPIGTTGRYSLPVYYLITPLSYLGAKHLLNSIFKRNVALK